MKKRVGNQELDGNQKWEARLIAQDKGRGGGRFVISKCGQTMLRGGWATLLTLAA